MDATRQSYEAAFAAIPIAIQSFDPSTITKSIRHFPVLRVHACDCFCTEEVSIANAIQNKDGVDKTCQVIGAILEPGGKSIGEREYCATRILNFIKGKNEASFKLVTHMVQTCHLSEGCGFFVLRILETVLVTSNDGEGNYDDFRIQSFLGRIYKSHVAARPNLNGSYWSQVETLLSEGRGRQGKIHRTTEQEATDTDGLSRSNVALRGPTLFKDNPEQLTPTRNITNSGVKMRDSTCAATCLPTEEDVYTLLKIIAVHAARPDHLTRLVSKHRTAEILIDMVSDLLPGLLPPSHGYRNAMTQAKIHATALLHRLLTITRKDPTSTQHRASVVYPVLDCESFQGFEKRNSWNSENSTDYLHRTCVTISTDGRLNITNIPAVTKHLVQLYLSKLSENFEPVKEHFKLHSWMSATDVADAAFASLSGDPSTLRAVLALWSALGSSLENTGRIVEIDCLFVSRLTLREELCLWLSNCSSCTSVATSRTTKQSDYQTDERAVTVSSYAMSPILSTLISLAKSAAFRRKKHNSSVGDELATLISILRDRVLWEVNRGLKWCPNEVRGVLHLFPDIWKLQDCVFSVSGQHRIDNAASLKHGIAICSCGKVSRGERCRCPMEEWGLFVVPDIRKWFVWIALESESIESSSMDRSEKRDDTLLQAVCGLGKKADSKGRKLSLFRTICTAILDACVYSGRHPTGQGYSVQGKMPTEFQYVFQEILHDRKFHLRNSLILEEVVHSLEQSSAAKELSTKNCATIRNRQTLRGVIDFILKWSLKMRKDVPRGGQSRDLVNSVERLLRCVYPTVSEMIDGMADMLTFTRYAHRVALRASNILADPGQDVGYICVLLGFGSKQFESVNKRAD